MLSRRRSSHCWFSARIVSFEADVEAAAAALDDAAAAAGAAFVVADDRSGDPVVFVALEVVAAATRCLTDSSSDSDDPSYDNFVSLFGPAGLFSMLMTFLCSRRDSEAGATPPNAT